MRTAACHGVPPRGLEVEHDDDPGSGASARGHAPDRSAAVATLRVSTARARLLRVRHVAWQAVGVSRDVVLSDAEWERIAPLMPSMAPGGGRPFADHRRVVEGIVWHYRTGSPWRDLPASFGPWQTVWKRHARFSKDGTWDKIHAALLAQADAKGRIDWAVSVDSTINRTHQHATTLPRTTGGSGESHESAGRTV